MRKVIVTTFVSLDGVMQAPGGPGEDPSGGFTLEGWSVNYWDDAMAKRMDEWMSVPFDLLLGRKTYDIFAAYWPNVTGPDGEPLNRATKYVASGAPRELAWGPSVLIQNVGKEVARLKEGSGPELQVHGSGDLIQSLMQHKLVDEFRVWTFPVLLGGGKRLFDGGTVPGSLKLRDVMTATTGVVIATYEPAGEIEVGSFAPEEPTEQ